jgi:hypothetical protein
MRMRRVLLSVALMLLGVGWPAVAYAAVPSNDAVGDATPAYVGFQQVLDTIDAATTDAEQHLFTEECGYDEWERSVWYEVTMPRDTVIHVDTTRSDYFAVAAVFTGPIGDLSVVKCGAETLDFTAHAGRTYYVGVVNYDAFLGTYLRISFSEGLPEPQVGLRVNGTARVSRSGAVTLTGSYTCRNADQVFFWLTMVQRRAQVSTVTGLENAPDLENPRCDGTRHGWSVVVQSDTEGRFKPGTANLDIYSYLACSTYCSEERSLPTRHVHLRPEVDRA